MITIVGGGPVGCHAAGILAKKGHDVLVLEEHKEIGLPIQCTGILTRRIMDIVRPDKACIVNRIKTVKVHGPSNSATIPNDDLIIDRARFDKMLAQRAEAKGANISFDTRVEGIRRIQDGFKLKLKQNGKNKIVKSQIIIGADGPLSTVSKMMGNKRPRCWIGLQTVVERTVDKTQRHNIPDARRYHAFFGSDFPTFFGWAVPENPTRMRIGVACMGNPNKPFQNLLRRTKKMRGNSKTISKQCGLIPLYDPRLDIEENGAYLVGDAATQVKATTGGGLVPGLKAAECLAEAIDSKTSYRANLRKVRSELRTSLLIRQMLDRFSDADYKRLVELVNQDKIKNLLASHDRDRPTGLVCKALIKEPRFALLCRALLR
ncbi:NAD(P)/FAD-dependent oxidoreductase [Candidatus Woesearchaeota archaeon]|nr:NAD(P)/FAD-dependent oxidoreductase [Candidatus Woesearchaeota archaeon]